MKEYKIGEVFRHTDGKAYQCVEGETCEGCAFRCTGNDCVGPYCDGGSDGRPVKFIAVTEPVEGMLYRAKTVGCIGCGGQSLGSLVRLR